MFLLLVFQYGGLDSVPLALLEVSICLSLLLAAVVKVTHLLPSVPMFE